MLLFVTMNNPTVEEALRFGHMLGDQGFIPESTARMRVNALTRLSSLLALGESHDAEDVMSRLEILGERLSRNSDASQGSIGAYVSRARRLLTDFLSYKQDPDRFFAVEVKAPDTDQPSLPSLGPYAMPAGVIASSQFITRNYGHHHGPTGATGPSWQGPGWQLKGPSPSKFVLTPTIVPLPSGKEFIYQMPEGGITCDEVLRIAVHLTAMATDFDATNPPFKFVRTTTVGPRRNDD